MSLDVIRSPAYLQFMEVNAELAQRFQLDCLEDFASRGSTT